MATKKAPGRMTKPGAKASGMTKPNAKAGGSTKPNAAQGGMPKGQQQKGGGSHKAQPRTAKTGPAGAGSGPSKYAADAKNKSGHKAPTKKQSKNFYDQVSKGKKKGGGKKDKGGGKKGKDSSGIPKQYRVGKPERVTGAQIDPLSKAGFESSQIDQANTIEGAKLRDAERYGGADIDQTQQAQFREKQMGLAGALESQMRGEGPSLAGLQLRQGMDESIAAQRSAAASGRGPLAQRAAAYGVGALGQNAAMQSAQLRFAEQLQAQQSLMALTGQARGQDMALAQAQAGMQQEAGLASMEAQNAQNMAQGQLTQQAQMSNQTAINQRASQQAALNQNVELQNAQAANQRAAQQAALMQQGNLANQQTGLQAGIAQAEIMAGIDRARSAAGAQVAAAGSMAGASRYATDAGLQKFYEGLGFEQDKYYGGQTGGDYDQDLQGENTNINADAQAGQQGADDLANVSDIRAKENISSGAGRVRKFLDNLSAYKFDYKRGEKDQTGVMAQDLEKSEAGDKMVRETKGGKVVDFGKGFATILAAQAELNKRLAKLEGKKKAA